MIGRRARWVSDGMTVCGQEQDMVTPVKKPGVEPFKSQTMESWQEESHNCPGYSARHECQQEPMLLNPRVIENHRSPLTTFPLFIHT